MFTISELKKMTNEDLSIELKKTLYKVGSLCYAVKSGQDKNINNYFQAKKYIARIKTAKTQIARGE